MDKRVKMIFAGLCLCVLLVGCVEDRDVMPAPDASEILDQKGIDDIKHGNGDEHDTTRTG